MSALTLKGALTATLGERFDCPPLFKGLDPSLIKGKVVEVGNKNACTLVEFTYKGCKLGSACVEVDRGTVLVSW